MNKSKRVDSLIVHCRTRTSKKPVRSMGDTLDSIRHMLIEHTVKYVGEREREVKGRGEGKNKSQLQL